MASLGAAMIVFGVAPNPRAGTDTSISYIMGAVTGALIPCILSALCFKSALKKPDAPAE